MKKDWGKWFILGKKPHQVGPLVIRKGRRIIIVAAAIVLAVPMAAWARGPIVRATSDWWTAFKALLGF